MQELQGTVESIVFQNEENGYVVARFKENKEIITIVGCVPYINEGQFLKLNGDWIVHPQFGKQFKVEISEEVMPSSLIGIERYLSSGVISGIGPVTAKKIIEKFKEDTLRILEEAPERLKEIGGLGQKRINLIIESYSRQSEIRGIMIFLQTYGVTPNQCVKIYNRFEGDSISKVKNNPYILTEEVSGIGFKTADKIARSLGIEMNSPFRIQSGIKYIINQFCALGNTYMPYELLVEECIDILGVSEGEIEASIRDSALDNKIKVEIADGNKCVFNIPFYYYEIGVTKNIIQLTLSKYDDIKINIGEEIEAFELQHNICFAESQYEAIKGAMENGIEIITGGPGTGKTTIINCITEIFEKLKLKVFMAAPTGRAAKRMSEATGREAKTIHRLLEMGVSDDEGDEITTYNKGDETSLECDVVIVDEASMIDIMLMNNLLKAITIGTRVIIVGDADQLPSVGPGNVLRDLIESNCVKVVRLKNIFRQAKESMIIVNAHKINNGEMPLLNEKDKDFYFIKCEEQEKVVEMLVELINIRLPKFNLKWDKTKHIQILSPMRRGILGVENLNKELQNILNPKNETKKEKDYRDLIFRVGDKVMQTKNNYMIKWTKINGSGEDGQGIFNGDVGFIEDVDEDNDSVSIIFDEDKRVIYDNVFLDELDLAYAMTVHKSQGSEFPVVIMPAYMGAPLLMNRNLFYTGITRAKQLVVLVGTTKAINFMVSNDRSYERYSLLKWRILEVLSGAIDVS